MSTPTPKQSISTTPRTLALTALAMFAFAANSVLCRVGLGQKLIDPASFAAVRVFTAALTLSVIVCPRWRARGRVPGNWRSAGALILFGAAQLTMIGMALRSGESFSLLGRLGFILAVVGPVILVSPGVTAPNPVGALLMAIAGLSWGVYSLLGRGAGDLLEVTANNFIYLVPCVVVLSVCFAADRHLSWKGFAFAAASGSVASGLGYVVWYEAQKSLSASSAATVQLSVPVIAAVGGLVLMAESVTLRLLLASCATLGGVAVVLTQRARR